MLSGIVEQFLYEKFANFNECSIESFYNTITRYLPTYSKVNQLINQIYWSEKFYPMWGINDSGGWIISESQAVFIETTGTIHLLTFDENFKPKHQSSKPKRIYLNFKNHISGKPVGSTIFYYRFLDFISFQFPETLEKLNELEFINYDKKFLPAFDQNLIRSWSDCNYDIWFYQEDAKLFSLHGNFLLCPADNLLDHIFGPDYRIGEPANGFNFYSKYAVVYQGIHLHEQECKNKLVIFN